MKTEFNKDQFSNAYADGMEDSYWNLARKRIIFKFIKKYKLSNILDVGCGRGIVTSYLYHAGVQITGVDLGDSSRVDKTNLTIYYNTDATKLPEQLRAGVDTISLFDVIEHISGPVGFIKNLTQNFPNLKNLIITVPARKELWSNFDDYYGHFRRYDLQMLKKEIEDSGFTLIFSRYFFHILYFLIRINNLLIKNRDINFNPPKSKLSLVINKIMAGIFYIETLITPGKLVGSSIICICSKNNKH
jgi:SAM-dependent methyltransferase